MSDSSPRLYLFHPGALGDGLLALGAIRALRKFFVNYRVVWFGHGDLGKLFLDAGEIDETFSFDRLFSTHFFNGTDYEKEKRGFRTFNNDYAVGWFGDPDRWWNEWMARQEFLSVIQCSPHDSYLQAEHMADRYLETLLSWQKEFSWTPVIEDRPLHLSFEPIDNNPRRGHTNTIVLHPGSGSLHKCAAPDYLAMLVEQLARRPDHRVILIGGVADRSALLDVSRLVHHPSIQILRDLGLSSIGRVLCQADVFIGHDSGVSHLAARLGIPSVVLFGPTDANRWAPRGKHVFVIQGPCHCRGWDLVGQCALKPCLSVTQGIILEAVDKALKKNQPGISPLQKV